jgi:two-component system cell cycle sensor histidine kinase/response regulator CckA
MNAKQGHDTIHPSGVEVVLVVEPEDSVRDLAQMILEAGGYVVLSAANDHEALFLCAGHQGPIDLLVTDLMPEEEGGPELAARAVKLRPRLKVLFMSGHADHVMAEHPQVVKGTAYIRKPFTPVGLTERVREALDEAA